MTNKLMTHVVAGYPTVTECIEFLLGMQNAGVYAIELQIPFSDPNADGPTIMKANDIALENGMTVKGCFDMIKAARRQGLTCPVYVMSYANKLFSFGIDKFCEESKKASAEGLIIPDLPFDTPEYKILLTTCSKMGLDLVPVISPGMTDKRLMSYGLDSCKLIYLTSTKGITGKKLIIRQELICFVGNIREKTDALIVLGFGIRNLEHVHSALKLADIAVVGSAIIRKISQYGTGNALRLVHTLVADKDLS